MIFQSTIVRVSALALALCLFSCGSAPPADMSVKPSAASVARPAAIAPGEVNAQRMQEEAASGDNWLMYGRTYSEQRFSPLTEINDKNVKNLGLAWSADIASPDGLEATPIVVDGTIYLSGGLGLVVALDAETGVERWSFRPEQLNLSTIFASWTSRFNRGVAVWNGKVFVGSGNCQLYALDAASGKIVWEVQNCDPAAGYGSTGAPRVAKNMVLIGNSGADNGARGYVSAYDTENGQLKWRFFTVPGDPSKPFEQPELKDAAKTWTVKDGWKNGGGSAWDAIVYDPELDQVYFGTDSALPWGQDAGDRWFTNAIIAVDADTGQYRWHYQTTPADVWDYNATMPIILADLEIAGQKRKVMMQAGKNGFFYVLDRKNGKVISADKFATVNWASHVDLTTGRPVENPGVRYFRNKDGRAKLYPNTEGAHNWHAMSFSPLTGLVYLPSIEASATYSTTKQTSGEGATRLDFDLPTPGGKPMGKLLAWDPILGKPRWSVDETYALNGGTLVTAGNLMFQGNAEGIFAARDATDGRLLWSMSVVSSTQAPPVTYRVQGRQYVLLPVGASGGAATYLSQWGGPISARGRSRLLAFVLDGNKPIPPEGLLTQRELVKPPPQFASAKVIERGRQLFGEQSCYNCHGYELHIAEGGSFRDLRHTPPETHARWDQIVLGGERVPLGMPSFKDVMTESDAQAIRAYVIDQAWALYNSSNKAKSN